MSIDDQELRAIHFLALRVRRATYGAGPWDADGLMTNLRKIADRNLHLTVEHVLRHAADPSAKTPGVLAAGFTPKPPEPDTKARPPKVHEACRRCGGFRGSCACTHEHRAAPEDDPEETPMPPSARGLTGPAAARAALRAGGGS